MQNKYKTVLITSGEPSSISSEITLKALTSKKLNENIKKIILTDPALIEKSKFNFKRIKINLIKFGEKDNYDWNAVNVFPLKLKDKFEFGHLNINNCNFVIESIETSVDLIKKNFANAVVTNPINKYIMRKSGFKFNGHTEFLASLSQKKTNPIMLLTSKKLNVIPLTTHIPISKISNKIKKEMIITNIRLIVSEFKRFFNIENPIIYVSGLNPHAGDGGKIGIEEINEIIPAIDQLNAEGYRVYGPVSADTMFEKNIIKKYDIAVCMFHDQALIPIKTLSFRKIVNVTMGLDFIRTSPDHGTALDIAGKNIASPESLISAIKKAEKLIFMNLNETK